MSGISRKEPGQTASKNYSAHGDHCEFDLAAAANDASQNQKGQGVGSQVSERGV